MCRPLTVGPESRGPSIFPFPRPITARPLQGGPAPYKGTGRKIFDLQVQSVVSGYCLQEFTLEVLYEAGEQQLQRTPATLHVAPLAFLLLLSHTLADGPTKPKGPVSEVTDFLYWKKHVVSWYWNYAY